MSMTIIHAAWPTGVPPVTTAGWDQEAWDKFAEGSRPPWYTGHIHNGKLYEWVRALPDLAFNGDDLEINKYLGSEEHWVRVHGASKEFLVWADDGVEAAETFLNALKNLPLLQLLGEDSHVYLDFRKSEGSWTTLFVQATVWVETSFSTSRAKLGEFLA